MEGQRPVNNALRRRHAASIAGYARVEHADPEELAATRQRGAETRGDQLRVDSSWGRRMAEAKRLKRYGPQPTTDQRYSALERRLARLEALIPVQDEVEVAAS